MPKSHSFKFFLHRRLQGRVLLQTELGNLPTACPRWVRQAVAAAVPAIAQFHTQRWQFTLRITSGATAKEANQQFRNKDYTPDVLTFPLWEDAAGVPYAGDILLGWPKVVADAAAQEKPLKAHVQHLVVHAMLHLVGEDHQTPKQAKQMETQEVAILAALGWPNPYL
jgi:probable rRNA maturation factor